MGGDGRRNAPRRAIQEVAGDRPPRERLGSQAAADNAPPSQQLQARAAYAAPAGGSTGIVVEPAFAWHGLPARGRGTPPLPPPAPGATMQANFGLRPKRRSTPPRAGRPVPPQSAAAE